MQVVIDLPEFTYNRIINDPVPYESQFWEKLVRNGVPLPKGHGRLIDADELLRELGNEHIHGIDAIKMYKGTDTWTDGLHTAWRDIDDAPTIVVADGSCDIND